MYVCVCVCVYGVWNQLARQSNSSVSLVVSDGCAAARAVPWAKLGCKYEFGVYSRRSIRVKNAKLRKRQGVNKRSVLANYFKARGSKLNRWRCKKNDVCRHAASILICTSRISTCVSLVVQFSALSVLWFTDFYLQNVSPMAFRGI